MNIDAQLNNVNPVFEPHQPNNLQEKSKFHDLREIRERALFPSSTSGVDQQTSSEDDQDDVGTIEEDNEFESWGIDLEEDDLLIDCHEEDEIGKSEDEIGKSEDEIGKSEEIIAEIGETEVDAKEETVVQEEEVLDAQEETVALEEEVLDAKEETAVRKEEVLDAKEEVVVQEEEVLDAKEEAVVQEDEMENRSEETARIEEEHLNREKDIEGQLTHEKDQIEQESEVKFNEGALEVVEGEEISHQVNTEIEQEVNPKILANNEDLMIVSNHQREVDSFIHLNQSFIHQHNGFLNQVYSNNRVNFNNNIKTDVNDIHKNNHSIDHNSEWVGNVIQSTYNKLDELGAQRRVDSELIRQATKHRLQTKTFEGICDENRVPLCEDEQGIDQLTQDIADYQQDHPDEPQSRVIDRCTKKWLTNKNLQTQNALGEWIPITPERRRELAIILSRGIVIQIVYQITQSEKASKKEKVEDDYSSAPNAVEEVRQQQLCQIHGQKFKLDSLDTIGTSFKKMVFKTTGTDRVHAKSLEESNKEIIDHSDRISQMVISKEMIKERITRDEIEHLDDKHVVVAIDRVRLEKLKKINGMAKESHRNMSTETKFSFDKLIGRVYA